MSLQLRFFNDRMVEVILCKTYGRENGYRI